MNALYRMYVDCRRNGCLEGIFIADKEDVEFLVKNKVQVYFGEVLGKHSEIYGTIEEKEIEMITDDENVLSVIEKYGLETGFSPFDYYVPSSYGEENQLPEDCMVEDAIEILRSRLEKIQ